MGREAAHAETEPGAAVLDRARAELLLAPRTTPHVWAVTPDLVVTVGGDLGRGELVRVTDSLRRDG